MCSKRRAAAYVYLYLIALLLNACAQGASPGPQPTSTPTVPDDTGPTRIGFAALPFERATYQPLIDAFNSENPEIQVEFVPFEPTLATDMSHLAREVAGSADTFTSMLLGPEPYSSTIGLDLRPLIDADASFKRSDYQPSALPENGPIRILPSEMSVQTVRYNADLWDAAGLPDPKADWSWDDLLGAAELLTQHKGDTITTYGFDDGASGLVVLEGLLAEAGISLATDTNGIASINNPIVAAAMKRVADLLKRGVLYQASAMNEGATSAIGASGSPINDGHVGLWMSGQSMEGLVVSAGGPSTESGAALPNSGQAMLRVSDATVPLLPRDIILSLHGYILSAGSAHPEAAWRWLSYLSQQQIRADSGMVLIGAGTSIPARRSLSEQRGFWSSLPASRSLALQATLERSAQLAAPGDSLVRDGLRSALNAIRSGQPAEVVLTDAQSTLSARLAERAKTSAASTPPPVKLPDLPAIPEGATKISFGAMSGNRAALQQLAKQYNTQHPESYITIDMPAFGGADISAAAVAKEHPCFTWFQAPSSAERTALRDLQPLLDADATLDQQDYPAALLADMRSGGKLYGLPYAVQLRALSYNRDLFEAAQLSAPTKDWTYEEFLQAATRLTNKTETPPTYGYISAGFQPDELLAFLGWQDAAAIQGGVPHYTDEAVQTALLRYIELLRATSPHTAIQGYTNDGILSISNAGHDGHVGMWYSAGLNGVFMTSVGGATNEAQPRLGVAPPPLGKGSLTSADVTSSMLAIAATASDAETAACWGWLTFLSEQPSGLDDRFPARRSVATSQAFLSQATPGSAELYAAYADALANPASSVDPYHGADLFWLMRAVDRALQGANLDRELAAAQEYTEQYLACVSAGGTPSQCATTVDPTYKGIGPHP